MALMSSSSLRISKNPHFSCTCSLNNKVQLPQARSHNFPDEGKGKSSNNAVDANMSVLRHRMERVRMKEINGWNYRFRYDDVQHNKHMMHKFLFISLQLATTVCANIGLVFLTGSLLIFLLSFIFSSSSSSIFSN